MKVPRRVRSISARLVVVVLAASHEPALSHGLQPAQDEKTTDARTEQVAPISQNSVREITVVGRTGKAWNFTMPAIRKLLDAW